MNQRDRQPTRPTQGDARAAPPGPAAPQGDPRRRTLAISLELAKNAVRAKTLEELRFVLVNDTRALIPFDRASLVTHFEGKSRLAAVNNQPQPSQKADFVKRLNSLAPCLKDLDKALVLLSHDLRLDDLPAGTADALKEYVAYAECSFLMVIPLTVYDRTIGHLLVETFGDKPPAEVEILALMNVVPFFSIALSEKWHLSSNRRVRKSFEKSIGQESPWQEKYGHWIKAGILLALLALLVFGFARRVDLTVGGPASVIPEHEYFAFVRMGGIVQRVMVKEGDRVRKDQLIAMLDPREIDFKIRKAERLVQSYTMEAGILRNMGAEDSSKLAESRLVRIKRRRAAQELDFLRWQKKFLQVRAPVAGVVLGDNLESLVGKKFKAGEPFCSIVPRETLEVETFVRESDVAYVKPGQAATVFFNFQPDRGFRLEVKSVSPRSEAVPGLGGAFKVKARFIEKPHGLKPGMNGIVHINTGRAGLWFVATRRIREKINRLMLNF